MKYITSPQDIGRTLSITDKALQINLNTAIYGTFAEIGAGQETARHFFRVGGASGTIAKAMSAYDKNFSDSVYGTESSGRYVSESRLKRMLDHEIDLLEQRIKRYEHPDKLFFSYANTVATIDFAKRYKGHGWIGVKFQTAPDQDYNEIMMHIRFKQNEARLQQETLGIVGVNLIHGAFFKHEDPRKILESLYDHIDSDTLEIDTLNFFGPVFQGVDNRLISLQLIKQGMTEAVIFTPQRKNVLPSGLLYKKNILVLRGSFRPVTKVNTVMYERSLELFYEDSGKEKDKTEVIFEITLSNLKSEGEINEQDFLDRADLLCSMGHTVMISNFKEYYRLVEYLKKYTNKHIGLTMGVNNLIQVFEEEYYRHLGGGILEAFGKMFHSKLKIYLYPMKDPNTEEIINSTNLKVDSRVKELYKFFVLNKKIVDISDYNSENLNIYSREVLKMIKEGKSEWEDMLPERPVKIIKSKKLFGYNT